MYGNLDSLMLFLVTSFVSPPLLIQIDFFFKSLIKKHSDNLEFTVKLFDLKKRSLLAL